MEDGSPEGIGYYGAFRHAQKEEAESEEKRGACSSENLEEFVSEEWSIKIPEDTVFPCGDEGFLYNIIGGRNVYMSSDEKSFDYLKRICTKKSSVISRNGERLYVDIKDVRLAFLFNGDYVPSESSSVNSQVKISGTRLIYEGFDIGDFESFERRVNRPDRVKFEK